MSNFFEGKVITIAVIFFVIFSVGYGVTKLSNEDAVQCTIISVDKVEATNGSSDGFYTEVYYIVTTDKGSYQIETSGINAHPECLAMKKDSTYIISTRGVYLPILGLYPNIISFKPSNH